MAACLWFTYTGAALFLILLLCPASCEVCLPENCKLPACYCPTTRIPGGIPKEQTPQMVVFTFDDAVNINVWEEFLYLFNENRTNPNGFLTSMTLFVSNPWTDYSMVKELYQDGHEIASHSVSHKEPYTWWIDEADYDDWRDEIAGERNKLINKAKVSSKDFWGMRSPFLTIGGDDQMDMLQDEGFEYDATMLQMTTQSEFIWPFTLDYPPEWENCLLDRRPLQPHPGLWEVPLIDIVDFYKAEYCAFFDKCKSQPTTAKLTYDMLKYNFDLHYKGNRAPFILNIHAEWFREAHILNGTAQFLDYLVTLDDVYTISVHKMLEWMRSPTPLSEIRDFEPWKHPEKRIKHRKRRKNGVIDHSGGFGYIVLEVIVLGIAYLILVAKDKAS